MDGFRKFLDKEGQATCPDCGRSKEMRGITLKLIDGKNHAVECQNPFHGERTTEPGEQCFDNQGKSVKMPD